jgi:hypothetical protein
MPLKKGYSKGTISTNIEHCMHKWKATGKVSGKTVGAEKARQMCAAMSYTSARTSAKGKSLTHLLQKGKR